MQDAWEMIEAMGLSLGAEREAIRKWRIRGVPARWQLRIMDADPLSKIDRGAFSKPPGPKRNSASA